VLPRLILSTIHGLLVFVLRACTLLLLLLLLLWSHISF